MRILILVLALLLPYKAMASGSDVVLYQDVAAQVADGEDYYQTAAELHRERGFPLHPYYTVRPPAHAYLAAMVGPVGLVAVAWGLLFLCLGAWFRNLSDRAPWERAAFLGLMAFGGSVTIAPSTIYTHEFMAGLLVTLALGLSWNYRLQIAAATLAILFRELAVPVIILLLYPLDRKKTIGVIISLAILIAYYAWHFSNVAAVALPTDLVSPGWFGMRGLTGLSDHMSTITAMEITPWIAFLPLAGWLFYKDHLPFIWCSGVAFAVCVIARQDNLFWQLTFMPLYWAGLVFLAKPVIAAAKRIRSTLSARRSQP